MGRSRRWLVVAAGVTTLLSGVGGVTWACSAAERGHDSGDGFGQATLTGFASLPARTFVPGSPPAGGQLGTDPINGLTPPFADQPVQGFSAIVANGDGTFDVLEDNGFGKKNNSADFLLHIVRIRPDFHRGRIEVVGGVNLTEPDKRVPFGLTRSDRVLTGADFDPESIVRDRDGSYWIGDEFGPFLLHVDKAGRVISTPVPLEGVFAPENPDLGSGKPNLGSTKGFEGMARSPDGRTAYPMLEGTVDGDAADTSRVYEFDLESGRYTGRRWTYQREAKLAIGDIAAVNEDQFLVIERDNAQGAAAKEKKVYLADRRDRDGDGLMDKTLVADLLNVANPHRLGGFAETFQFPFANIETLVVLDQRTIGVLNDNNFPTSDGHKPGQPDDNEFITLRLSKPLHLDPRVLS